MPTPRTERNAAVVDLAESQHGAVSSAQLVAVGVSRTTIGRWIADGRLHRRHQGVYALGQPRLSDEGRLWAAVLATNATLYGPTAAWAWRILPPHPDPIHLTDTTQHRRRPLLHLHRSRLLNAAVDLRGLLTTSLEDTLRALPDAMRRRARANAAYAGLLRAEPEPENDLELQFLGILRAAGLPLPRCQHVVLGRRRDFVWPEHRLIVETDGRRAHLNPVAFEADRRRDAEALTRGWRTIRFTRDTVWEDPGYVTATLRGPLTAAGTIA